MADTKPTSSTLFAEFGVRLFAFGVDIMVVMLVVGSLVARVSDSTGLKLGFYQVTVVAVLFLYFAGSWASPLRATPTQLLLGIRVVEKAGETLSFGRASVRALALAVNSVVGYSLVFLAAVTPNRQAAHDWLAQSVVVNRKALSSGSLREQLLQHIADTNPQTINRRRLPVTRMIIDVLVLPELMK